MVHYRNEELSQMLLDCFHPARSMRYTAPREKFARKIKVPVTPARYATAEGRTDPASTPAFDDAPGWIRGEEWAYVALPAPESIKTSASLQIPLFPTSGSASITRGDSTSSDSSTGTMVHTPPQTAGATLPKIYEEAEQGVGKLELKVVVLDHDGKVVQRLGRDESLRVEVVGGKAFEPVYECLKAEVL